MSVFKDFSGFENLEKHKIWANAHETRESLQQLLFAGNLGLSPSIPLQFTLLQPKIAKKSPETHTFRV